MFREISPRFNFQVPLRVHKTQLINRLAGFLFYYIMFCERILNFNTITSNRYSLEIKTDVF